MSSTENTPLLSVSTVVPLQQDNDSVEQGNSAANAVEQAVVIDKTEKSIDNIGSFSLLLNNIIGPAMLGFPHLFQQAGLIPTIATITFIFLCATLNGTLLSDAISSIPGNRYFNRNIDFSTAFHIIVGQDWYILAEALFLIACVVQAIAAIVESAQSVDGFLASFLFGKTYALQLTPFVGIVSWSPDRCMEDEALEDINPMKILAEEGDCVPFHGSGSLIISVGFLITALIFLPLGRGHIKETMSVQLIAFTFMMVLLAQFTIEFIYKGFPYEIPLVGTELSQLAGVVLFNYAFVITVPAWLNEKMDHVSVNKIVWGASTTASIVYAAFGIMGAMTFQGIGGNALIILTSRKVLK